MVQHAEGGPSHGAEGHISATANEAGAAFGGTLGKTIDGILDPLIKTGINTIETAGGMIGGGGGGSSKPHG